MKAALSFMMLREVMAASAGPFVRRVGAALPGAPHLVRRRVERGLELEERIDLVLRRLEITTGPSLLANGAPLSERIFNAGASIIHDRENCIRNAESDDRAGSAAHRQRPSLHYNRFP